MGPAKTSEVRSVIISEQDVNPREPETFAEGGPPKGELTWHTLFSSSSTPTDSLCGGIAICPPVTGHLCAHRHEQAEIYYIIEGQGIVTIDGKETSVQQGAAVFIPGNSEHGIRNTGAGDLRWFYVFATDAFEDVVYRFSKEA